MGNSKQNLYEDAVVISILAKVLLSLAVLLYITQLLSYISSTSYLVQYTSTNWYPSRTYTSLMCTLCFAQVLSYVCSTLYLV